MSWSSGHVLQGKKLYATIKGLHVMGCYNWSTGHVMQNIKVQGWANLWSLDSIEFYKGIGFPF